MSPLYLLDTNVALALVRGKALGAYIDATFGLRTGNRRPAISVVTHGEVRVLASRNGWGGAKLTALQDALPGRRHGEPGLLDEPVLLHQVTVVDFDGTDLILQVGYVELFANDTGGCGLEGHEGDTARHNFYARLSGGLAVLDCADGAACGDYRTWPGSNGRPVIFPTWGKHHHKSDPSDEECGVLGAGEWIVPLVFGSQIASFCEGDFVDNECVAGFDPFAPLSPRGFINLLTPPPYGYDGVSVYSPDRWGGADPIIEKAYEVSRTGVAVDLGGRGCGPEVRGPPLADGDGDGIPDSCDPCIGADTAMWAGGSFLGLRDSDFDTVSDGCDACPFGDDRLDTNRDGEEANFQDRVPDGCDGYATTRIRRAAAVAPFEEASFSGTTAYDYGAGLIELDLLNNQAPKTLVQAQKTLKADLTTRRCFCVDEGGIVGGERCLARDVPDKPLPTDAVCGMNGRAAPASQVDTGLGWLPFRSLRRPATAQPVPEFDPAPCVARRVGDGLESCTRSVVTYAPEPPSGAEAGWSRRPNLTWDAWSEIRERDVFGDHDIPAVPESVWTAPPALSGEPLPGSGSIDPGDLSCQKYECPKPICVHFANDAGIGYSCIEESLPHGAAGQGGFWTRLENASLPPAPGSALPLPERMHDGYLKRPIDIRSGRTSSSFHRFPAFAHRFLAPWVPVERFPAPELTLALGGTPAVFNAAGTASLALFAPGRPDSLEPTALGTAEPYVRGATALALAAVRRTTDAEGPAALQGAEIWTYEGSTGVVRRIAASPTDGGFDVVESLETGLTAEKAVLAVPPGGDGAVLAIASSPWSFYRVGASAAEAGVEPFEVPGSWEGSLALVPAEDAGLVRALGIVSEGAGGPTVAWATLRADTTADVHFLPHVPVREGLWFGFGRDELAGRDLALVGGGTDGGRVAHSDVYAVDLEAGGETTRIAEDDGADLGADGWITGARSEDGWTLRIVPARSDETGRVRYGAYLRRPEGSSWAPAGMSALDTPRPDATRADVLAFGSSCELDDAPWHARPGTWTYDDDPSRPVLRCAQPAAPLVDARLLPRQVKAFALGERELWTVSQAGLERWRLGASTGSAAVVEQLALGLPGKPKDPAVLAANDAIVVAARGDTIAVFALGEDESARIATVTMPDDVVALHLTASDIWVIGERQLTHLRLSAGALSLVGRFELVRHEGDVFARRLTDEPGSGGDHDEGDHDDGHGNHHGGDHHDGDHHDGDCGHGDHDDERPGDVVGSSLRGAILALALEHDLVTLDVREPSRLPTLGSRHFDEELRAVGTDGRFVYLRTRATESDAEEDGAGAWRTFRATAASALDPAEQPPARSFAKKRQYAGRWAARLTGVALHLALRAEMP